MQYTTQGGITYAYPESITKNRASIEAKMIGCLSNDITLLMLCPLVVENDMKTLECRTFFEVLKKVYDKGSEVVDSGIVDSVLDGNEDLRKRFIQCNGMNGLKSLQSMVNIKNFDTYLEEFNSSNYAMQSMVAIENIKEKLSIMPKLMSGGEIQKVIDYSLADIGKDIMGTEVEEVGITDDYIKGLIEQEALGVEYGLKTISKTTKGLHEGNFSLFSAPTGVGKSTVMFNHVCMPLIENNEEKVLLYCNESEINNIRELLLVRTLYDKIGYYKLSRNRLTSGKFNADDLVAIKMARDYIEKHYSDKILFKRAEKYSVSEFVATVRRYAYKGVKHFFLDTFKSEDRSSANVRGELVEGANRIYAVCRSLNVHVYGTFQSAMRHTEMQRRLIDKSVVSEAKAVLEVMDILITARPLYESEYTGKRNDIKPFNFKQDAVGTWYKEYITLEEDKKYILMNVAKNRYGEDNIYVVYEDYLAYGLVKEIGRCRVIPD